MAGVPGRSGGHNAKPIAWHQAAGTYRPDRHAHLRPTSEPSRPVSVGDRRRTLRGLSPEARRIASRLLSDYEDWSTASLETLRSYARSCARLAVLELEPGPDTRALHRELRANVMLLKALDLERAR